MEGQVYAPLQVKKPALPSRNPGVPESQYSKFTNSPPVSVEDKSASGKSVLTGSNNVLANAVKHNIEERLRIPFSEVIVDQEIGKK